MALWPTRGQKAPNFWDALLKAYIDEGDAGGVSSVNTRTGAVTLNKADVGLNNVDNTSDAAKPVSTAQANADAAVQSAAAADATSKANAAQVAAVQRANHTGTQAMNTVTGLTGALGAKADLVGGVVPDSQIPPLAILDTHVVASQSAMVALTAQKGDVAVRTDINKTFRLQSAPASTLGNWVEMPAAGAVTSVAGKTGTVALAKADVGLGNVDNTSDANKPVSTAQATAIQEAYMDASNDANAAYNSAIQRANHTGAQAISTVTGLQTALDGKAPSNHTHDVNGLTATGTKDATTFLRGDNTWAVPAGGGGGVSSVNTRTGAVTLNKSDVGLSNVDNTSDANKPVSTAQAAAIDDAYNYANVEATSAFTNARQRANHTGEQPISTVTGLQAALDGKAPVRTTINAQTGATYTPVLADENKLVTLSNTGAITVTLPSDASVAIPVGGRIDFAVLNTGMATFVAGSGATANGTPSLVTRARYSAASAIKVAANTWLIVGDLA